MKFSKNMIGSINTNNMTQVYNFFDQVYIMSRAIVGSIAFKMF